MKDGGESALALTELGGELSGKREGQRTEGRACAKVLVWGRLVCLRSKKEGRGGGGGRKGGGGREAGGVTFFRLREPSIALQARPSHAPAHSRPSDSPEQDGKGLQPRTAETSGAAGPRKQWPSPGSGLRSPLAAANTNSPLTLDQVTSGQL